LANVLDTVQQDKKLKMVAEDVLQTFLDSKTYSCEPARVFLREIMASVVLGMTVDRCSKPEWMNGWIVYLLEEADPAIVDAIDAGLGQTSSSEALASNGTGKIMISDFQSAGEKEREDERKKAKRLSKAEAAMEEAMQEAKRLSELIAQEDAKKTDSQLDLSTSGHEKTAVVPDAGQPVFAPAATPTRPPIQRIETGNVRSVQSSRGPSPTPASAEQRTRKASIPQPLSAASADTTSSFTNFDQMVPQNPTALHVNQPNGQHTRASSELAPLTLHNANILILEGTPQAEKSTVRAKPTMEYLVQIEPRSSFYPGWMIVKKYADFESLHEVLRRISVISGVTGFADKHATLPHWKGKTQYALRIDLEQYIKDSVSYKPLAESEGMKRFLEKEQAQRSQAGSPPTQVKGLGGVGQGFENMGKGMLNVLTSAPQGVAKGGEALFGGVAGVFGGQKKPIPPPATNPMSSMQRNASVSSFSSAPRGRPSEDSIRVASPVIGSHLGKMPPMERRVSSTTIPEKDEKIRTPSRTPSLRRAPSTSKPPSVNGGEGYSRLGAGAPTIYGEDEAEEGDVDLSALPPPPSDITDDYDSPLSARPIDKNGLRGSTESPINGTDLPPIAELSPKATKKATKVQAPFSDAETRVTVELMFAVLSELFTLSSAWTLRRTLLGAAKTFLLRPGNASLDSIRILIQDTVIDGNSTDEAIAAHLEKLRANSLPTVEELASWPAELTDEEKEALAIKARKLLMSQGMPSAIRGVMGDRASAEALGKVFDVLQQGGVARGLVFGILLQGVRAVTQ
jgi:Sorting nexin C terminal/PXA domain